MSRNLVTVATYSGAMEAQIGRAKLQAHGLRAFVADDHLSTMNPQYMAAAGGIRLQVETKDAADAEAILDEVADPEDDHDDADDGPRCPSCELRYAAYGYSATQTVLGYLFLGIPFLFLKKGWSCGKCHHTWSGPPPSLPAAHPYRQPRGR